MSKTKSKCRPSRHVAMPLPTNRRHADIVEEAREGSIHARVAADKLGI